jgi:hypothetical protein
MGPNTPSGYGRAVISWALVVALLNTLGVSLGAQTATPTAALNPQVVINGGIITVAYDLNESTAQTFAVTLEVSRDGGATYAPLPKAVSGDVGSGVTGGAGKRIQWDASPQNSRGSRTSSRQVFSLSSISWWRT